MKLSQRQLEIKGHITTIAKALWIDPLWASAIAMVESSLGQRQKSPTGCVGVFQMSSVAMKDLLQEMSKQDDEFIDIACGVAFLYLLLRRHKTIENATAHFCDPADRFFYVERTKDYMKEFSQDE